mgnify:CR=1 FL=1
MIRKYIIHTDGGSRGNPGPAALGAVIEEEAGTLKKEYGEYIGRATNNEAEYKAVIFALKKLKQLVGKEKAFESKVEVRVDSELLERQINGRYKILDGNIQPLFLELWNLKIDFSDIKFKHVPRQKNRAADRMVNAALDRELNKLL